MFFILLWTGILGVVVWKEGNILGHPPGTEAIEAKRKIIHVNRSCLDCLFVTVVSQMLSPGNESAFFSCAGNGVVEKQSDYASYRHACRQQHGEYLIDFCNT